jgi:cupin superfamily acireductone dioxygenase involved in methionine salvage
MNGDFHTDDGDTTVLLMITPTLINNSGCFQIKENNEKINTINFVKNKLIIFPAKWEHKGCAPIEKNIPRITLAFKTEKYE